jgi:hypothetical protein
VIKGTRRWQRSWFRKYNRKLRKDILNRRECLVEPVAPEQRENNCEINIVLSYSLSKD